MLKTSIYYFLPMNIIAFILTLVMIPIHIAGGYLGLREGLIPRSVGVYISVYEAVYYLIVSYLFSVSIAFIGLVICSFIHLIGAFLYLKGALGKFTKMLKYYGIYEIIEMAFYFSF
jgi:hypothetical protein